MNTFMNELKSQNNYAATENGAITHVSTLNPVLDLFALGGSYRNRSAEDCIVLFKKAANADSLLALKCLFYLRDVREGQGERRFFRTCYNWLAKEHTETARRNFNLIPEFGRYDDLFCLFNTPLENDALSFIKTLLSLDLDCKTPSLLAKWLPSENASSTETKKNATKIRKYLGMTHKQYRKTLSILRERINIVERLMSSNQWDKIEFDKLPSRAGMIYKNAFARRDMIKAKFRAFAEDKNTKVNAATLYPYDIAHQAFGLYSTKADNTDRLIVQKQWDNLPNYYGDNVENGLAVVDVSGSMSGRPMEAAVGLGAYIAEKAHGPFAGHFITFSEHPQLVEFEGVDITDKFCRARKADWGMNTDIEAVFDMLLMTARTENVKPSDIPTRLYIFSDMEFDYGLEIYDGIGKVNTLLESIAEKWAAFGYELPQVIFWNLDARNDNIPALGERFSYVSGLSPVMIETILSGKSGIDLMLTKLNSERYSSIVE